MLAAGRPAEPVTDANVERYRTLLAVLSGWPTQEPSVPAVNGWIARGHSSIAITGDVYGHVSPDVSRDAVATLGAVLSDSGSANGGQKGGQTTRNSSRGRSRSPGNSP